MYTPVIKDKIIPKELYYNPTAVIVGQTGAGKTSLVNKLCGTEHGAGAGKGSITQNLFRNDVAVGKYPFKLIDTPGTDSSTDTYKHAYLLKEGLTATAINTIFIILKFDNRFEKMVDVFYSQPVYAYAEKIVVMISHLDLSKDVKKDFKDICDLFAKECPDISNIIFYSEQSQAEQVAGTMFSCISNMDPKKIEISDEQFLLNFNCFQATHRIRASFNEYRMEARNLANDYNNFIHDEKKMTKLKNDRDEVLHMMLVEFKNELDSMYDKFVKKHGADMVEMDYYTFSIKMQKENVKLCDDFTEGIVQLMSYNLFDIQDPRNLIKKCPYCGLIWYKSEGCNGETWCGKRNFSASTASSLGAMFRFVITKVRGELYVDKNPIKKPAPRPEQATGTASTGYKGCNRNFVFGDLPKLDDELILSLYKVKTIDEAKAIIKSENFDKVRTKYERNIDTDFHE